MLVVADEMGSVSWTGIVGERAGVVGVEMTCTQTAVRSYGFCIGFAAAMPPFDPAGFAAGIGGVGDSP